MEILKYVALKLLQYYILENGCPIPGECIVTAVIPAFKRGRNICNRHRGISLLNCAQNI